MIENWIKVFSIIQENETLREIVSFTLFTARTLNADPTLAAFDICDLTKLFDVKSTTSDCGGDSNKPAKPLYHYILKYAFKFNQSQNNLSELFREGQLQVFSEDEMQVMR